jgi:hypothetical protein
VFREVAVEFSRRSSATKGKSDAERHGAVISDPAVTAIDQILPWGSRGSAPMPSPHISFGCQKRRSCPAEVICSRLACRPFGAMVTELKYRLDIETFEHLAAKELLCNEISFLNIVPPRAT